MKYFILLLKKHKKFQPIRVEGPESHYIKQKTPTMGGLIINISLLINILLFCNLKSPYVLIAVGLIVIYSMVGLSDDVIKVFYNNTKGFAGAKKLILQSAVTAIFILYLCYVDKNYLSYGIFLPLFNITIPFGSFIVAVYLLIICGSSNAANITDGLDGLLSVPVIMIATSFLVMILFMFRGHNFSGVTVDESLLRDLSIILVGIIAVFSSFMIYNHHPAKIFMGDVGSLPIGAIFCYISILLKVEILYAIMSILFIVEIMSSIIQVVYFKMTNGKRIFKMAPIHHHFEKCGFSETQIVHSMWLFTFACCAVALGLYFCV
jgi:phospho-N-acetylmuramoyl-pentapeptide-transferase